MREHSLKERIKYIAQEQKRTFQDVWKSLILERILVRVGQSEFADQFVFKGGQLLSRYIDIGRQTKDIDFLARMIDADSAAIRKAFESICAAKGTDGFVFSFTDIATLDHQHMNYPGHRVRLHAQFGTMQDRIQIDVGVGDIVEPRQESLDLFQYKGATIFEGGTTLWIYPIETIFAEKLETVVSKGAANSRMKDFHDLVLISRVAVLSNAKLKSDIEKTFDNRRTLRSLPLVFLEEDLISMNRLWNAHLRTLASHKNLLLPATIAEIITELNQWLIHHEIIKGKG